MHEYEISLQVTGYVNIRVEAESLDAAEEAALEQYGDMDFGPLEDIQCKVNEEGNVDLGTVETSDEWYSRER